MRCLRHVISHTVRLSLDFHVRSPTLGSQVARYICTISVGEGKKLIQIQYSSIYSIYRHKTVDLTTMLFCLLFLFVCFLFVWSDSSSLYSQSRSVHTKLLLRRHRQAIEGQAIQVKNLKRILEQKVSHLP